MSSTSIKVTFTLDAEDAAYFRDLFSRAKRLAKGTAPDNIIKDARQLVESVRKTKKTPKFVIAAVDSIEDLVEIIVDEDYAAPKSVQAQVLGALAYFSNPHDLIPDDVPVLGFLDDAIMVKFVEQEFRHELAAYRKFKKWKRGAEQRPWTSVASSRLPARVAAQRDKLRAEVDRKRKADEARGLTRF